MKDGRVAGFGRPREIITPENLEAAYGIEMDVVTIQDRYGVEPVSYTHLELPFSIGSGSLKATPLEIS